ncbi:MAG: hypothetical protein Q4A10_05110 [Aerococcaceae bacterium]|nr:hypothetical protein [Aerococcaceae bacterium]
MEYEKYYHVENKFIVVTYAGDWYKEFDYIELKYSSWMESYALFFYKENLEKSILRVYNDSTDVLEEVLNKACSLDVIDLSEYYEFDDTDFGER